MKLMITEKKSQVDAFITELGWKKLENGVGEGNINGERVVVTCARGHLLGLAPPDEVVEEISWTSTNGLTPIPKKFKKVPQKDARGSKGLKVKDYLKRIKKYAGEANGIIIAADPDKEGDLIGWEIVEFLNFKGDISRILFGHGMSKAGLEKSIKEITSSEESKKSFRAAEARERGDWASQFATRLYTYLGRGGVFGPNICQEKGLGSVFSLGRVQTPVLEFIYQRCQEIENFVSQEYYTISADFQVGGNTIPANYVPEFTNSTVEDKDLPHISWKETLTKSGNISYTPLLVSKAKADSFIESLKQNADKAIVKSFEKKEKKKNPPGTFDLSGALAQASREFKMSNKIAQEAIESLYQKGYTSYPRTDDAALPDSMYNADERNPVLDHLSNLSGFSEEAKFVKNLHDGKDDKYQPFKPKCFTTQPMAHYGIVPTSKKVDMSSLTDVERKVYGMIVKRYILQFYPPATLNETKAVFEIPVTDVLENDKTIFRSKAEIVIDAGFMTAFGGNVKAGGELPNMTDGTPAPLTDAQHKSKKTTPPSYYDDTTLPEAMKTAARNVQDPKLRKFLKDVEGLGTAATRTATIEKNMARKYIYRDKDGYKVTKTGIDILKALPSWIKSPEMTAVWEGYLDSITKAPSSDKSAEMRDKFIDKQYSDLSRHIQEMIEKHEGEVKNMAGNGKPSAKQIQYAESLAYILNIDMPDEVKENGQACSNFIENNKKDSMPSLKMFKLAEKISQDSGTPLPQEARESFEGCKKFIDDNKGQGGSGGGAPTEKMVNLAKKLANDNNVELPKEAETDFQTCKDFIDDKIKNGKRKPSEKMVSFAKNLIESNNIETQDGWEEDYDFVKSVLDQYGGKK